MNLATFFRPPTIARFVMVRYVGAACALSGCVPSTQYEQATSAAEVEREGHRRAAERLAAAEAALKKAQTEREALLADKKTLEASLQKDEHQLAQASLDIETTQKQREQEQLLVTQLRGELARIGEHIKTYQDEKGDLESRLQEAEARLAEKDQRIVTLEGEIQSLRAHAVDARTAQAQLAGALDELAELQKQTQQKEPAKKDAAPAKPDTEEDSVDDNGQEDTGEVLPSEEG